MNKRPPPLTTYSTLEWLDFHINIVTINHYFVKSMDSDGKLDQGCSTNNKNPETEIGVQPEKQKSSQATKQVLTLPRLGNHRLSRLGLSPLIFMTYTTGIKYVTP